MSDLIERGDAIKALYKYNFVTKEVIEREIMSIPSADRPRGEWEEHLSYADRDHRLIRRFFEFMERSK